MRQKFLLLYLLCLLLGLLGGAANYLYFINPLIGEVEQNFVRAKVQRVAAVLQRELQDLRRVSVDWSAWTGMYNYVQQRNPEFAAENFIPETLDGLDLDLMLVYDRQGRPVTQLFSATAEQADIPRYVQKKLRQQLNSWPDMTAPTANVNRAASGRSGFLPTPLGVLLLAIEPIYRSDYTGPSVGVLVFGRLLTPEYHQALQQQAALAFSLQPAVLLAKPPHAVELRQLEHGDVALWLQPRNGQLIDIRVDLFDINRASTLQLTAAAPRELSGLSMQTLEYSLYFALGIFVLILALFICFVHLWVTQPLRRLNDYVTHVRHAGDFVAEPPVGRDEIGHLARAFTSLLDELILKQRELRRLSQEDGLTQVANRRRFNESWPSVVATAQQLALPLSLIMIDVDYFKRYNDYYGHLRGDEALRQVARCLQQLVNQQSDLVARYGGEEFVVYLQGCDLPHACQIAEAMCVQVRQMAIPHVTSGCATVLTLSCGVSGCEPTALCDAERLLRQADQALYLAKERGRNRVESYGGGDAESGTGGGG